MFDAFEYLLESSVDYPRPTLSEEVWDKSGDSYTIKSDVKSKILDIIEQYPNRDLIDLAEEEDGVPTIHIVGSIGTNQYIEETDIDVHIVVDNNDDVYGDEEYQKEVKKWFDEHRDELGGYIGSHPIEVYLQYLPEQEMMSDSVYHLINEEWIIGPKILPEDFDPYEEYSDIFDDVAQEVEDADKLLGELKRDVIDYEVIQSAVEHMSEDQKQRLKDRLQAKLNDIEDTIEELYGERKEWVEMRKQASRPETVKQAREDIGLAKKWKDTNALFKMISRYHYMKTIGDLQKLIDDDGEITDDEVDVIKDILGA